MSAARDHDPSLRCADAGTHIPRSPRDASPVLGLEWHYHAGVVPYPIAGDHVATAYAMTRARHVFLTDDNHTWSATEISDGWFHIVVRKNENSPYFVWKPGWVDDGPGARWFSDRHRIATQETVARELSQNLKRRDEALSEAQACRDTVRGRKARRRLSSLASEYERRNRVLAERWPAAFALAARAGPRVAAQVDGESSWAEHDQ